MSKIGEISLDISKKIGHRLNKTEEEVLVMNYGLFMLMHTSLAIIVTIIVGILTGMLTEMMIISLVAAMMKRYSGGVHASSPERCVIVGLILSLILSFSVRFTIKLDEYIIIILGLIVIIYSFYTVYKKCPVPSPNKPFKNINTRKKLRKKAMKLMAIYLIIIIGLYILYKISLNINYMTIIMSILMGIVLQVFALGKLGESIIGGIDKLLTK